MTGETIAAAAIEELTRAAASLRNVTLNVTFDCKLRCVYCPTISPDWHGVDADAAFLEEMLFFIRDNRVAEVSFGMWGDTLAMPDWYRIAEKLRPLGVRMNIHSAFNRLLDDAEVDILSSFSTIMMSIDTPRIAVQKEIRKGLDVRTLIYNLHQIRARALERGERPRIEWTCVLTDRIAQHVPELVGFALSNGIDHLAFNDLGQYEDLNHGLRNVFELRGESLIRAIDAIERAMALAQRKGLSIHMAFFDRLLRLREAQLRRTNGEVDGSVPPASEFDDVGVELIPGKAAFHSDPLPAGKTRLCTQPWDSITLSPEGEIYPCCIFNRSLGKAVDRQEIHAVIDNADYRSLRAQLLTGDITEACCRNCPITPAVEPNVLASEVRRKYEEAESRRNGAGELSDANKDFPTPRVRTGHLLDKLKARLPLG